MKPKTFKAKTWMLTGIHHLAHDQDITDGEWVRRAVMDALTKQGYTPDTYFNNKPNN